MKFNLSVISGRIAIFVLRLFGRGATAAPGLVAEAVDGNILQEARSYFKQIVLITGTNGKTTTAAILSSIAREKRIHYVNNTSGSNLKRGIITSILPEIGIFERKTIELGIFECDEAALIPIALDLRPDMILFGNLFRDQLDRYGEVESIRKKWINLVKNIPAKSKIILNADDPSVTSLAEYFPVKGNIFYYGLSDKNIKEDKSIASDFLFCPVCGNNLNYSKKYFSHLGEYRCSNCSFKRPDADLKAEDIKTVDSHKTNLAVLYNGKKRFFSMPLLGLYNVYNFLAASSAALAMGLNLDDIEKGINSFNSPFGRQEIVDFESKKLIVTLVKNPVGFSEALSTFFYDDSKKDIAVILNDNIADGADVSWIWDAEMSYLKNKTNSIIIGGRRLYDMALRLKYEEIGDPESYILCDSIKDVFDKIAELRSESVYVFPTYTALIQLKAYLSNKGYKNFWE